MWLFPGKSKRVWIGRLKTKLVNLKIKIEEEKQNDYYR